MDRYVQVSDAAGSEHKVGRGGEPRSKIQKGESMDRRSRADGGQPVDPGRARSHGYVPDAVEVHRSGGSRRGRHRAEGVGPEIPASGPASGRTHEEEVVDALGSKGTSGGGARRY